MERAKRLRNLKRIKFKSDEFWFEKRRRTLLNDALNKSIMLNLLIARLSGKKFISLFELCNEVKTAEKLVAYRLRNLMVFDCFAIDYTQSANFVITLYHEKSFPKELEE